MITEYTHKLCTSQDMRSVVFISSSTFTGSNSSNFKTFFGAIKHKN